MDEPVFWAFRTLDGDGKTIERIEYVNVAGLTHLEWQPREKRAILHFGERLQVLSPALSDAVVNQIGKTTKIYIDLPWG